MLNFERIKQDFDNLPRTIFHYTSADGLNGILCNSQLWFTRWDSLNDTSEHRYIHSIIRTCLDELNLDDSYTKYLHALNETFLSFKQDNANIQIDKHIYLASFSSNGDSVPMWTYYTKSAQNNGYCIGFDSIFLRESFNETNFSIAPVIYSENIQKEIIRFFNDGILNVIVSTTTIVLLCILAVLIIGVIVLYFLGKKAQKKQVKFFI